tara:strand:+ start:135 stop:383 length:249 start_codon:yes stop_codon:yes gene_type:complete
MNKLENALNALGLDMDFFNEMKSEIETEKLVTEHGLLKATDEDIRDEVKQLDTSVEDDPIDEDDESQIDMEVVSPSMREVYQ